MAFDWTSIFTPLSGAYVQGIQQGLERQDILALRRRNESLQLITMLNDIAGNYARIGQRPPESILRALNQAQQEIGLPGYPLETPTATIGVQRPEEGGLNQFLTPRGTQQVPTGPPQIAFPTVEPDAAKRARIFQQALAQTKGNYNQAYRLASSINPTLFPPRLHPESAPGQAPIPNVTSQSGRWELFTQGNVTRVRDRRTGRILTQEQAGKIARDRRDRDLGDLLGVDLPDVSTEPGQKFERALPELLNNYLATIRQAQTDPQRGAEVQLAAQQIRQHLATVMGHDPPPSEYAAVIWARWHMAARAPLSPQQIASLKPHEAAWLRRQGVIRVGR